MSDLDLIRLEQETCFVMVAPGRFVRENSPDRDHLGPRVSVFGCAGGAIAAVRSDLDDAAAARVFESVATAPPGTDAERFPTGMADLAPLVGADPAAVAGGPCFHLSNGLAYAHPARFVAGESEEGRAMLARFARDGMPPPLVEAGYVDVGELWPPWCAAMADGEIAALCCAARLGVRGAEAGLYTFAPFRARGYGAAVTAAWSRLPSLAGKTLFYSTQWTNRSSIAVTRRLGLRRIGWSARIG